MHRTPFPRLQYTKLEIDQGDIQGLTQFMRTWDNAPLESFEIELTAEHRRNFTEPVFLQPVEELHSLLGEHCQPDSLTKFNFNIPDGYGDFGIFYHGRCLRSLFCFGKLTNVTIRMISGFDIDDATLCDLACAWPYLRELSLASKTGASSPPPRATLHGLQALAQHCPELHTLAVTFDATDVPRDSEVQITQRKLVSLDVGASLITTPIPVAQLLAGTFVNLRDITHDFHRQWAEVIKLLQGIREETQKKASTSAGALVNPGE
ncbi:hypothetical protein DFH06DRAFT_285474 [Mycena polygramma]|nr:hypothetical protein DFH06DRAFT_285474 [Mycena polygramma]